MRTASRIILALALAGSLATCTPRRPDPTVVVVLIDTLRWDALGCNGNPRQPSPRIDEVAADGVRFERAISTSGWTLPAVGSLLTGAWPLIHGGLGKGTTLSPIREELPTAAEILRDAGFSTVALANAAFVSPMLDLDRGFDVFDHRYAYNDDIRRADETVREALRRIDEQRDGPKFVFVHLFDPHLDYDPPGALAERFAGARRDPPPPLSLQTCLRLGRRDRDYVEALYLAEVAFVDAQVGVLVDGLRDRGLYDDTTLIITSDHGEELWDHGGFEHGHTLYDELTRIPLILKLPGDLRPARRVVGSQVRILDVMPTVFELVGVEQPGSFVGASLMPLIRGEQAAHRVAYSESTLYGKDKIAWRTGSFAYIYDMDTSRAAQAELYDWRVDPGERHDLIDSRPDVAARLETELKRFLAKLAEQAGTMSELRPTSLSPEHVESLKSLGYIR